MDNFYKFINTYNLNNNQNHRYLIIGNSGSGKTSLAISLILSEMPRHKKIYFIIGAHNILLNRLKKDFEENNVEIEIHEINSIEDLDNLNISPSKNDLVVLDDLTHLMKNSKKLMTMINKIYTASRQSKYNVILILHKLKMFNGLVRQNSTKIFITSLSKEIMDEFEDFKNVSMNELKKHLPIVINENGEAGGHVVKELNFDRIKFSKELPIIEKNINKRNQYYVNNNQDYQILKKDADLKQSKSLVKVKKDVEGGVKNAITSSPIKKKFNPNLL